MSAGNVRCREIIDAAQRLGWSVSTTNGGHLRLDKAGRPVVFAPRTPSDIRGVRHVVARLRRADRGSL